MARPETLGDLKTSGYRPRPVKEEMRANLIDRLAAGDPLFPGVLGYDDTVVPQLVNAILARQNFILLGLRGQAKTRIVRQLAGLLDEELPIIAGSEINDDPFRPVSKYGRHRCWRRVMPRPSSGSAATPATWRSSPRRT
jgi:magnesium chelatase subunit I